MVAIMDDGCHIWESKLPKKIYVHKSLQDNKPVLYFPRVYCNALITMDDEHIVGYCKCSNCGESMNQFAKYCSNCGAKSKGRIILGEDDK